MSRKLLSALVASALVAAAAAVEYALASAACGGEYVYPIDDTYIHIAMAGNLAGHGTWGVEPGRMAFCSSSPLWTLLLSGLHLLLGANEFLPWLLSLAFNILSVVLTDRLLARLGANFWSRVGGALAVAIAGPFVCTTALGMEHAAHGFFVMAAVAAAYAMSAGGTRTVLAACAAAAAATATRYESLFILLPLGVGVCALEMFGRWRAHARILPVRGLLFLLSAALPVFAYGLWALAAGGHFLPNSLLLKGSFHTLPGLLQAIFLMLGSVRPGCGFLYLLAAALLVVAVLRDTPPFWRIAAVSAVIAIGGQMLFASVGQLCRYEAYLTSAGCLVIAAALASGGIGRFPVASAPLAVLGLTAWVFADRAERSFADAIRSSSDIRNQQVLMTRMMAELPEEDRGCVALNDLGYMSLHGGFPFVDLWGLGSQDATELLLKHPHTWLQDDVKLLFRSHGVKYAVLFLSWYPEGLMPEGTIDVATLTLKDNFACGSDVVIFRATSPEAADSLERHLAKYVDRMPPRAVLRLCRR